MSDMDDMTRKGWMKITPSQAEANEAMKALEERP